MICVALCTICVTAGNIRKWQKSGRLVVVARVLGLLEVCVYLGAVILSRVA